MEPGVEGNEAHKEPELDAKLGQAHAQSIRVDHPIFRRADT